MNTSLLYQDIKILESLQRKSKTFNEVFDSVHNSCDIDLFDVESRLKAMDGIYVEKDNGKYSLTLDGKSTLLFRKQELLRSIFLPIIVSILTNLAIVALKWLLPLIQRLLSSFL